MKFIQLTSGDRTYFINPLQITPAQYVQQPKPFITVKLTEAGTNGQAASLMFQDNAATAMVIALESLEMEMRSKRK